MQDDLVERVAAAIQQAFYEGGGYEGMARAAMAATREIDAEAMEPLAWKPKAAGGFDAYWAGRFADWLQQRAKGVTDA